MPQYPGTTRAIERFTPGYQREEARKDQSAAWMEEKRGMETKLFQNQMTKLKRDKDAEAEKQKMLDGYSLMEGMAKDVEDIISLDLSTLTGAQQREEVMSRADKYTDQKQKQLFIDSALRGGYEQIYQGLDQMDAELSRRYGIESKRKPNVRGISVDGKVISAPSNSRVLDHEFSTAEQAADAIGLVFGTQEWNDHVASVGVGTAAQKEFAGLTADLSVEDVRRARRIELGLDPRAVGSSAITITEQETAKDVAVTETILSKAKEAGKLTAQFKLKPGVEKAVKLAIGQATATADANKDNRSNALALSIYDTAMKGLMSGLGGSITGPIVGLMPAMTADQQIAEASVAAMAPVLKQLFRSAGEGIFTDKDQELLLQMIPTRKTLPAARASQLKNIDAIVRAKLAHVGDVAPPADQNTIKFDAQGNIIQ